ncbi:MAG: lysophospholipase [Anaerolineaceae bacterium]|nr:lysophospholipase [Anaerolineaceae bacterium]
MNHFDYSWTTGDGMRLFGQAWSPIGDAQAVICLVHGLGEHSGRYQYVAEKLTGAGFAVISFDLRGHGKSEGIRGHAASYDLILDDIAHLLKEAGERFPRIPRFLYGHSLGGNLVITYVLRRQPQIAGVISTSPILAPGDPVPGWKMTMVRVLAQTMPSTTLANSLDLSNLSHDPTVIQIYQKDALVHDRISARLGVDMIESGQFAMQHAHNFHLPLLIMQGSADRIVSPEMTKKFASQVPGDCTLKVWEGYYHETHNEPTKDRVIQFMIEWLGNHISAPSGVVQARA